MVIRITSLPVAARKPDAGCREAPSRQLGYCSLPVGHADYHVTTLRMKEVGGTTTRATYLWLDQREQLRRDSERQTQRPAGETVDATSPVSTSSVEEANQQVEHSAPNRQTNGEQTGDREVKTPPTKIRSHMHRFSFRIGAVLVAVVQVAWMASLVYWGLRLLR